MIQRRAACDLRHIKIHVRQDKPLATLFNIGVIRASPDCSAPCRHPLFEKTVKYETGKIRRSHANGRQRMPVCQFGAEQNRCRPMLHMPDIGCLASHDCAAPLAFKIIARSLDITHLHTDRLLLRAMAAPQVKLLECLRHLPG